MPFAIDSTTLPGILLVTFRGPVTTRDRERAMEAGGEQFARSGVTAVLLDFSQATPVPGPLDERLQHAKAVANRYRLVSNVRIAYVTPGGNDDPVTIEAMAAARGYFFERFAGRDAAIAWLQGNPPAVSAPDRERRGAKRDDPRDPRR